MKKRLLSITTAMMLSQQVVAEPELTQKISNLPGVESIVFDENKNVYFTSLQAGNEKDDGSIIALNSKYEFIATIVNGLDNPKGISIKGELLYIADMTDLIEVNLRSGTVIKHHVESAEFLNDVAIDKSGNVYISDMFTSEIYKFSDNKVSKWMDSPELENPNGLLFIGDDLYIAAWGYFNKNNPMEAPFGRVLKVNPKTKVITAITEEPLGNLDGLQLDNKGQLIVSDWKQGVIYSVSMEGEAQKIIDLPRGPGDIYYSKKENKLLIPMAIDGEILSLTE
ncbi:SMP-30/gluconolactonase/LRE family protein [Aliivibrio logei]|uniref:SMP-30/gluconolactonase/LRE family protein n=1 Tax=Aliivibrio logei TaxID=688 RepID=UPI0035C8B34F